MSKDLIKISILTKYYQEIEKIIVHSSQFATVEDYVNFVLQEMLFEESGKEVSKKDEEQIKHRLRDLGYM